MQTNNRCVGSSTQDHDSSMVGPWMRTAGGTTQVVGSRTQVIRIGSSMQSSNDVLAQARRTTTQSSRVGPWMRSDDRTIQPVGSKTQETGTTSQSVDHRAEPSTHTHTEPQLKKLGVQLKVSIRQLKQPRMAPDDSTVNRAVETTTQVESSH